MRNEQVLLTTRTIPEGLFAAAVQEIVVVCPQASECDGRSSIAFVTVATSRRISDAVQHAIVVFSATGNCVCDVLPHCQDATMALAMSSATVSTCMLQS